MPTANTIGYKRSGDTDMAIWYDTASAAIELNTSVLIAGEGNQTIVSNLDQSALAAGLNGVLIQPGSSISMRGSAGTFAKFGVGAGSAVSGVVNGVFLIAGQSGEIYYTPVGAGTYTTCLRLKNITGYRVNLAGGGTVVDCEMAGAAELFVDNSAVTNFYQDSGSSTFNYYATALTYAEIGGGSMTCGRACTNLTIGGGAQVQFTRLDSNTTPPAVSGTISIGSGRLDWRGGNIGTLRGFGSAMIDLRNVPAACTITNLYLTRAVADRSYLKGTNATVTITNTPTVRCGYLDTINQ